MAADVKVTCDRCGEHVRSGRVLLVVRTGRLPRLVHGKGVDLCEPCGHLFEEWLGNLPALPGDADLAPAEDDPFG